MVLIASGPSAKHSGIEALRGKVYVLAVKQGIEMAPWADAVYGCDHPWWEYRQGLPNFKGLKMAWQGPHTLFAGVVPIRIPDPKSDHLLLGDVGVVGSGRNSGFQALNLAVQFGMRRGLLIGYDATDRSGVHYYGRNNWSMANNPTQDGFAKWQAAFHIAAVELKALGIEVWNAGQYSAIKSFRKLSVLEAAREWGL